MPGVVGFCSFCVSCVREFEFPLGLKPSVYDARSGTAEALPFQIVSRPSLRLDHVSQFAAIIGQLETAETHGFANDPV